MTRTLKWENFRARWFFWWMPQLGSEPPTLNGVGSFLSPAGTGDHRSWDVQRKSRGPPGPCRTGFHIWAISPGRTSCFLSTPQICRRSLAGQTVSACSALWPGTKIGKQMWSVWWTMSRVCLFFLFLLYICFLMTYFFNDSAGSDAVIKAHPATVVTVLPWTEDILVAKKVAPLIQNPPATFYLDRIASVNEAMQVSWVPLAVVGLSLKVPVLVKHNLERKKNSFIYL